LIDFLSSVSASAIHAICAIVAGVSSPIHRAAIQKVLPAKPQVLFSFYQMIVLTFRLLLFSVNTMILYNPCPISRSTAENQLVN
jgi:hypothetical protein